MDSISASAPARLGAPLTMPRPATTAMSPRPLGPAGAGKVTNRSGAARSASITRATWSKATHTSSPISGSSSPWAAPTTLTVRVPPWSSACMRVVIGAGSSTT
jgi:hypothetical protein